MEREIFTVGGTDCCRFGEKRSKYVLIVPCGSNDFSSSEKLFEETAKRAGDAAFSLCCFAVGSWNRDLSPWEAPPVFGKEPFGDGAEKTLAFLQKELLPTLFPEAGKTYLIGGYSLAAFFALWAAYQTDAFAACAAASPSVWFPNWDSYFLSHKILAKYVYLSLGDREEKAKNPVFARVGDRIRLQKKHFEETGETKAILEWNEGNHFRAGEIRTAKGFAWALKQLSEPSPPNFQKL